MTNGKCQVPTRLSRWLPSHDDQITPDAKRKVQPRYAPRVYVCSMARASTVIHQLNISFCPRARLPQDPETMSDTSLPTTTSKRLPTWSAMHAAPRAVLSPLQALQLADAFRPPDRSRDRRCCSREGGGDHAARSRRSQPPAYLRIINSEP